MSRNPNADTPSGPRRSRADQVLGDVGAGIAIRLGVDPILVRIAAELTSLGDRIRAPEVRDGARRAALSGPVGP